MNTQNQQTNIEQFVEELDGGTFFTRVARALSEAAAGAVNHRGKGKVTVEFSIKPIGESRQVEIDHTVAYVEPTAKGQRTEKHTTSTPMYVNVRGKLSLMPETPNGVLFKTGEEE